MKETVETINRMQEQGVIRTYAIGGAVGATFYLEPVATMDVDVFVSVTHPTDKGRITLGPVNAYVKAHSYEVRGEYIVIGGWPVQFLPPSDDLGEEAIAQARETDVEGVSVRVMTAEHLVAIALQVGRAKDHARIVQFVEAGVLDSSRLDGILRRHGLVGKWESFERRYLEKRQ